MAPFFKKSNDKLGIALGGGAALGAAHVGIMKAFLEKRMQPEAITGTSIGAFVAAHIAFGVSIDELEKIAVDLDWLDITSFKISKLGLLTNEKLGKRVLDTIGRVNIEDAEIPLGFIATDIITGNKVELTEGPLYKAVMASSCLPGIFAPVEWEDMLLVDGFLCENVPVSPLKNMGIRNIVAIDLTTNRDYKRPEDIIDVLSNTFDIGLNNMIRQQIKENEVEWIQPSLSAYNRSDTSQTEKLIEEGYKAVIKYLEANN